MDSRQLASDGARIALLLALIFALLFALTWTGFLKCRAVPGWCGIYYGITNLADGGKPDVLIVYGNSGLGNPELLEEILSDPNVTSIRPRLVHISHVNSGNLKEYNMVVVEKARQMSSEQLKMFIEYVNGGGYLVWTGDAGVEPLHEDELLYEDETKDGGEHIPINAWTRKSGNEIINFDQLISVRYIANFCDVKPCSNSLETRAGLLVPETTRKNPLIRGLSTNLVLNVFEEEDFAIVERVSGGVSTAVLDIDYQANLFDDAGNEYGSGSPLIVQSGFGERVAYYALPPEYYANPKLEQENKYLTLIGKMYTGMVYG